MGISFTSDQQKVIDTRHKNILVSAAAGSGKTAVLVERIVQLVTDDAHPVDIDRLLIVTFTSAAASEMRERISNALMKRMETNPENEHLQRQMTLIHNAQITTIDSFCLFVVRNNFNDIGLDPGFRVADEAELQLMRKDVLAKVLEEQFALKNPEFYYCVECYSTNGREKSLEEFIFQLYQFAMSYPFPEKWLQKCKESYEVVSVEELQNTGWIQDMYLQVRQILQDCEEQMQEALQICELPDGPYMYADLLHTEIDMVEQIKNNSSYETWFASFSNLSFGRLPSKKDDSVSVEKREMVKGIRNGIKETLQKLKENYFWISPQQTLQDMQQAAPAVRTLIDLTLEFKKALAEQKREKNLIDFSDMEHFALQILLTEEGGEIVPSKAAIGYQEYFEEILIDEYQDSNWVQEYLLQSISKESSGGFNRFMVGDVKQSIYKFRLARPEIFMEKYESYQGEKESKIRIDLKQNFRSREEVIESVNFFFSQIMIEGLGGVKYDRDAALYLGASYPMTEVSESEATQDNRTEILLIEKCTEEKPDNQNQLKLAEGSSGKEKSNQKSIGKKESEALVIANRIKELVGSFLITDKETNQLREAEYRDIVILLRSNSGWDDVFRETLTEEGIPTYVASKTGYFSSIEIQGVLNFLRVLDNPLQDIPLCAVLTNPVFAFTEEELAEIRIHCRKGLLYDGLQSYHKNGNNEVLAGKIDAFMKVLEKYRKMIPYTPIHELLHLFMEEVGYYYYMSALPAGEQRKANMQQLLEKAINFEKTSYHGLFHFIRYIEQMQKYDVDMGEANIQDENANVVRIMSIHKSKGLEFPICFVAGMSKRFNMQDARKTLVMDLDYGIGTDYINPELRYKTATLQKNVIAMKMQQENLGEELRILYVALTRAKEKLIMTGVVDDIKRKISSVIQLQQRKEQTIPYMMLYGMNTYMDYILAALIRQRSFQPVLQELGMQANERNPLYQTGPEMRVRICQWENLIEAKIRETVQKDFLRRQLLQKQYPEAAVKQIEALQNCIHNRFSYQYPHAILAKLYTKTTVSELKKMGYDSTMNALDSVTTDELGKVLFEEPEIVPYIPKFMQQKEEMSGTARGSAYHRVLELLNLEKCDSAEAVQQQIEAFVRAGRLSKEYAEAIQMDKILQFLQSDLAKRMRRSGQENCLYREQPFVLGIPANRMEPDFPEEETILVQGIIDVYFQEGQSLVVADYKTDKVDNGDELWKRYKMQLDYYAEALTQLVGLPVKEKIIYSFALGKGISC